LTHDQATGAGSWNTDRGIEDDHSDLGRLSAFRDEEDSFEEGEEDSDESTISDVDP
jgi:hypothetical protein